MPINAQTILDAAIDEVNNDAEDGTIIEKNPATALLGPDSCIDSLSLVRLLVTVERLIEEQTGKSVTVVDESVFDADVSPFSTVQALTNHIAKFIT